MNLWQVLSWIFSFAIYTYKWSWSVGLLLVLGIGLHECSHLLAAKYFKISTAGFYLIPFIGGVALITSKFTTYWRQAMVSIAGPVGGTIIALISMLVSKITHNQFMGYASAWLICMNLFNLLPLSVLDGGQIADSIFFSLSKKIGIYYNALSTVLVVFLLYKLNLLMVILLAVFSYKTIVENIACVKFIGTNQDYLIPDRIINQPQKLSTKQMFVIVIMYICLISILISLYYVNGYSVWQMPLK